MSLVTKIGGRGARTTLAITWTGEFSGLARTEREPRDHMVLGLDADAKVVSERGLVPARALVSGDRLADGQGGWSRVAYVLNVSTEIGRERISIAPDALGPSLPSSELILGRRHRLRMQSDLAEILTGQDAGLVAAEALLELPGVELVPGIMSEVVHIAFEHHGLLIAEGVVLESFAPTPVLLESIPAPEVESLYEALPKLRYQGGLAAFRPLLPEFEAPEVARLMAERTTFAAAPDGDSTDYRVPTADVSKPSSGPVPAGDANVSQSACS